MDFEQANLNACIEMFLNTNVFFVLLNLSGEMLSFNIPTIRCLDIENPTERQ